MTRLLALTAALTLFACGDNDETADDIGIASTCQATEDCPLGTMMKAASKGPLAVPMLPPTWNTDCAVPCRPPEASRAMRDDSGWNTADPRPTSAAASRSSA